MKIKEIINKIILQEMKNLKEAKWIDVPGSYGGTSGSFPKYIDGTQWVIFYLDQKSQKFKFEAQLNRNDKPGGFAFGKINGDVPSQFENEIEDGNEDVMTKVAKLILSGKIS